MFDIVYYFAPREHMNPPTIKGENKAFNIDNWTEIVIMDSYSIYDNNNWREMLSVVFFVDKTSDFAQFLWEIRDDEESLLINKKLHRFREKYTTEFVESEASLAKKLEELSIKNYGHTFLYTRKEEIYKIINIEGGETVDIFVRNEDVCKIEKIINRWADKTDFFKYELDQERE